MAPILNVRVDLAASLRSSTRAPCPALRCASARRTRSTGMCPPDKHDADPISVHDRVSQKIETDEPLTLKYLYQKQVYKLDDGTLRG